MIVRVVLEDKNNFQRYHNDPIIYILLISLLNGVIFNA